MTTARLLSAGPVSAWRDDGRRVLQQPLVVDLGVRLAGLWGYPGVELSESNTTTVTVPTGFDHDGASIPYLVAPLLGDEDRYEVAGIVHDYLYRVGVARSVADHVFWRVARSGRLRVRPIRAWLGWAGLRIGGWVAYRRIQRAQGR